ncbi:MAG: PqqD family protein [Acutalibacteraceae bacterium]
MIIKKELVLREIMGENMLVPCGKTVFSDNGLFMLNDVGCFIWKILPAVSDENEIVQRVLDEYDIEPDKAKEDIENFLASLRSFEIID